MRRLPFALLPLLLALGVFATPSFAAKFLDIEVQPTDGNLKVTDAPSPVHGGLYVTFREVGLGKTEVIEYQVTADATASYACINKGDNHPQAANKESVSGQVTATATFYSGPNGQISGAIAVPPLSPGNFSCPPGQTLVLTEVSYTNVVLTDVTNGVTATVSGTFSLVFYQL